MDYALSILGQPVLEGPNGPIRYTATKAQALLWHLAAQPERAFSRSHMTTMLWPDDSESEGRNRLNTTLSRLRQAMPIFPIRQNGDMLQWDRLSGMALDTQRFLEISRVVGLEGLGVHPSLEHLELLAEAVSLWRGPLLQGFIPAFSSTYEEWLEQERHLWERRILEALARLVQLEEGRSAWDRMIAHSQQALQIDPLQERFYRWLMTAYYQSGERAAALNQYTLCAQIMEVQLGATPDPATTRLRDQIVHGEVSRVPGRSALGVVLSQQTAVASMADMAGLSGRDAQILAAWSGRTTGDVRSDAGLAAMGHFALIDPLTGLYNRRYLETLLEIEIRSGNSPVLALLDMQGLRRINDTLGFERGDAVLRTCAAYFKEELPQGIVARMGGGGFGVLFVDEPIELAASLMQQVLAGLPAALVIPDLRGSVEFAAGLAACPDDGADLVSLHRAAEGAVYWAKKQRGRKVRLARDLTEAPALSDPRSPAVEATLAGRESLWERMQALLDQAASGKGSLLVLEGSVGSGRSRLLAELAHAARSAGWKVAAVAPDPNNGAYVPISAATEALSGSPPSFPADGNLYHQATELVQQFQEATGNGQPVLLCIDDLHEAGNLTALALVQLGWKLHRRRMLIVVSVQAGVNSIFDWSSLIAMGMITDRLVREQVAGLDLNGTRRLAFAHLGSVISGPAVRVLHETTGGNPLHISQVLKAWVGSGVLTPGSAGWTLDFDAAAQAPRDLFQALVWRVRQLEPDVQEMLGLAGVLGRQFRLRDLRALSGATPEALAAGIDRAVQEGILVLVEADLVRFAHPILQEAAYSSLNALTRRLAHGMAGLMLAESVDGAPAQLARHFDGAGHAERSFAYHVKAGEEAAARHAYIAARHHLGRAWQIMPITSVHDPAQISHLALRLCRVSLAGGDVRSAIDICREALQQRIPLEPNSQAALLVEMGKVALAVGDTEGLTMALTQAESLRDSLSPHDRLPVAALRARCRLSHALDEEGLAEAVRLAGEARQQANHELEGELLSEAARAMLFLGHPRLNVAETAQQAIARLPIGRGSAASVARIIASLSASSLDDALGWMQEALEAAVLAGEVILWPQLLHLIGRLERASGNWQVARSAFDASLLIANRNGGLADRCTTMGELAILLAWLGEHEEAAALATTAVDTATAHGRAPLAGALRVQMARCQIAAGRPREALRTLAVAEESLGGRNRLPECHLAQLDALIQSGELHRAVAQASGLQRPAGETLVYHALLLGRLARRQGRPQEALRWLNQAIAQAERPFAEQYEIAQAYAEQAYALHALGDVESAERSLQSAREMLARVNAGRLPATN